MNTVSVGDAVKRLALTRLAHFTPARNLWHITADDEIRSSKDLAENAPEYFSPTDRERFDLHPDKVCCSFQYPNGYYLAQARAKPEYANYPGWVCLLIDSQVILRPGTLFSPCNAAKDRGIHAREGDRHCCDATRPAPPWAAGSDVTSIIRPRRLIFKPRR